MEWSIHSKKTLDLYKPCLLTSDINICKKLQIEKKICKLFLDSIHINSSTSHLYSRQSLLESMVDTAESLCPHVMKKSHLRAELMKASSAKMVVPKSFVTKTLLEQSGVDIINKIRCVLCVVERYRRSL